MKNLKKYNNLEIIKGDICYPKYEALIIPANASGLMTKGIPYRISRATLSGVPKEVKKIIKNNDVEVGTCFQTYPGRMNRRKVKQIYHAVIKRVPNDFTTLKVIKDCLNYSLNKVIQDGYERVTICSLGLEDGYLDEYSLAQLFFFDCSKYLNELTIKILDDNENFINHLKDFYENLKNEDFK